MMFFDTGTSNEGKSDYERQIEAFKARHGREPRGVELLTFL